MVHAVSVLRFLRCYARDVAYLPEHRTGAACVRNNGFAVSLLAFFVTGFLDTDVFNRYPRSQVRAW